MKKILITGGAGFVGSNIAIALKEHYENAEVIALDNLHRKGATLNIERLAEYDVKFLPGDVRKKQDLNLVGKINLLIECSAEPSVLAGIDGDTDYLIKTNLNGAVNCADICRKYNAPMLFLSTSRVYPIQPLLDCEIRETETRFDLTDNQKVPGLSAKGVSEAFPMSGARSLYGGTKYAAEVMLREYADAFDLPVVINRCGVIAGPWQFGKADQGIAAFWTAAHVFGRNLKYIGFGGTGKQVRDMLHIDDLIDLVLMQIENPERFSVSEGEKTEDGGRKTEDGGGRKMPEDVNIERSTSNIQHRIKNEQEKSVIGGGRGEYPITNKEYPISNDNTSSNSQASSIKYQASNGVWNVGGGVEKSASLLELTNICREITGNSVAITPEPEMRYADIPIYITDNTRIKDFCGWQPRKTIAEIVTDIHEWILATPEARELFS